MPTREPRHPLIEIATSFLTIGAMSYGGPAIMGIMQCHWPRYSRTRLPISSR